jgi:enoyl-CoA hydratase/carnithine racemase
MTHKHGRNRREGAKKVSVEQSLVLSEIEAGVVRLTLNRPAQYNLLSSSMIAALHEEFNHLATSDDIRVVILAASGRAFCAGHDLAEIRRDNADASLRALFDRCSAMMLAIDALPMPVIAQVQGIATAAGCQLVAACDMAVASDQASFATSGIKLGLFCSTPSVPLVETIGAKHAAEMLFTGAFIDSQRALAIGLVNRVVPAQMLEAAAQSLAASVAQHSKHAITSGKRLLRAQRAASISDAYAMAAGNMARDMQSLDAQCGIDAFLAKRESPNWVGK